MIKQWTELPREKLEWLQVIPECLKWELLAFRWRQHNTKMSVQDIFPLLEAKNILENDKWKRLLKCLAAPEIILVCFVVDVILDIWLIISDPWYLRNYLSIFFLFCKPPLRLLTYLFWKEKCLLSRQNIRIFETDNFNKIKYEQSLRRITRWEQEPRTGCIMNLRLKPLGSLRSCLRTFVVERTKLAFIHRKYLGE